MSQNRPEPARRRNRVIGLLAAVGLGVVTLAAAPAAEAGKPAPTPAATITIDSVVTPSIAVPATDGSNGLSYVVRQTAFDVTFSTDLPLSTSRSTTVVLTVTSGPDAGTVSIPLVVPPNVMGGTISGAVLPTPANNVTLKVAVDARRTDVTPGTINVDVLKTSLSAPSSSRLTGIGGGGGIGVACSPTPSDPVCGDLVLPAGGGATTDLLLSQGSCDSLCNPVGSFLQMLVGVDSTINHQNPMTLIAKCDKSLCAGKGIKSYKFAVQLTPTSPWTDSPACAAKGVIDTGDFCTDYRQSTRDNAGDLYLYVLFAKDLKGIFR